MIPSITYDPNEPPFHKKWRPAMAWSYMMICLFDFMFAPLVFALINAETSAHLQWQPLTLMGGGLYHVSMLAIVGVSAYGRTQEKIKNGERIMSAEYKTPDAINHEDN